MYISSLVFFPLRDTHFAIHGIDRLITLSIYKVFLILTSQYRLLYPMALHMAYPAKLF